MRSGQVLVVYRSPASSSSSVVASQTNGSMRRLPGKDAASSADPRLCTKENCLSCCKKFTAFMFSRVGLFFVMIGYVAIGGWLFQALEAGNEENMRRSMSHELNTTLYKLWAEILRVNSFPWPDKRGNFTVYAAQELEKFESTVIRQVQQGFDGRTRLDADADWNYFGAILYAVTLVSTIGYGHITTKTTQGKIATILYSAFGVPLMMLFVANIGSTMAKMFAFVFSRITMIFCCRWRNKRKRKQLRKQLKNPPISIVLDQPESSPPIMTKSSLKHTTVDEQKTKKQVMSNPKDRLNKLRFESDVSSLHVPSQESSVNSSIEIKTPSTMEPSSLQSLPADIRLNMLTGVSAPLKKSRSSPPSTSTTSEHPKDALTRINELIRQNSVQDVDQSIDNESDDDQKLITRMEEHNRRRSIEISPIQFYIDETNRLTNSLEKENNTQRSESTTTDKVVLLPETPSITTDEMIEKSPIIATNEKKKTSKKNLKRSKSESTHNRKSRMKKNSAPVSSMTNNDDADISKSVRRGFFSRKVKKQTSLQEPSQKSETTELVEETNQRKLSQKSQSFNDRVRPLSPPPGYEESTHDPDITSLPATTIAAVTWKHDQEFLEAKSHLDITRTQFDDDDEDQFDEEDEKMSVPLLVTVFVIPLYLTLGAILFNIWENWGFLNSFYFCFITLTTIGFGDFVPGSALTVSAAKEKLISAALYILLGLVLIAMCFNLMKEQLTQKLKQVAGKWGILEF